MNLSQFFSHWKIRENPFRGEEARDDSVLQRLTSAAEGSGGDAPAAVHSDFEKILGDLDRPSTSVVFGEKGSGKTALRLQMTDQIRRSNASRDAGRVLLVSYDDLNVYLDALHDRLGHSSPESTLERIRLTDHMDAVLSQAVGSLVDGVLGEDESAAIGNDELKRLRGARPGVRRDLLFLASVYSPGDPMDARVARLRRKLRLPYPVGRLVWDLLAVIGWVAPVLLAGWWLLFTADGDVLRTVLKWATTVAGAGYLVVLAKRGLWDRLRSVLLTRRLSRELRMLPISERAWATGLAELPGSQAAEELRFHGDSEELRFGWFGRLRQVASVLGYRGVIVLIDRVDEPVLVQGDGDRMRSIVWPLLNNKFLQLEGLGVKMLLPLELRYALFRETSAFFQEARLDKQSLVERLSWTGPMLYDLCSSRLNACREPDAEPISLLGLFEDDVGRQDLVDALDQMHQPRDAFKFLYRCISEHCSNVTAEDESWRIPRLVLDQIRKQEADRVQQLYRGIRPA